MSSENNGKLTLIKHPAYARYITKNGVVVAGQGCSIIDLITKKETKLTDEYCSCSGANHH